MDIYLDESGNLTRGGGAHFIVGTYTVGNPMRVKNAFRRWQRKKFPKKIRGQSEVKFNDPHIDDELRLKTIRHQAQQDIRIFYTFLKTQNIPESYHKGGAIFETGLLYTEIVVATLELYLPITESILTVIRDKRMLKGINVKQFNETATISLLPKLPAKAEMYIHAVDSASNPNVQVADWICGALARFHEKKPCGKELYAEIKRNIVQEKELFQEYWESRWKKK